VNYVKKFCFVVSVLITLMICASIEVSCKASTTSTAQPVTLNISAAASLTDALKEINTLYTTQNPNVTITPNFASSGTLQTQIQNGAPADVFISAAAAQMDNLQKGQLIVEDTRKNLLVNKVVLIVPVDSTLGITSFMDLATDKVKMIAIGDPKSVPAGTYAQQAFDFLGIMSQVQPKYVMGSDVRGVLSYVESGNVDAGIIYSTDALTSKKVKVVANAPDAINAKVVYPVAVIKASKNMDTSKAYENFLFTKQAKAIFEKYGFNIVGN
jgi:molybdate transport system substrate-binding protein